MMRVSGWMMMAWLCVIGGTVVAQDAQPPAAKAPAAPAMDEKTVVTVGSYGIGANMGQSLKSDGVDIELDSFIQGLRDGLQGAEPKYTSAQIKTAFKAFQARIQQRNQLAGDTNKVEGRKFLADNKTKPGIVTLPSGLQYKILRAGNGISPKGSDTVKVHYEGTLLDGKVFDSSIKRKEPASFQVDGVIPGWTEALQLMKVGDRWKLFIPSDLAYGEQGSGKTIGPNSVLIFDVELLDIQQPAK
jgi:FKBP-type peptidyl-prolyl cis-trans isomerase FklB